MAKIMIVDDTIDIVETLKIALQKKGHETNEAHSGDEFLKSVEEVNPDLVLLDVMMPGLNTRQILERLKEKGKEHIKIILVTVVRFADAERDALQKEYNIVDYITKPFDVFDLLQRVEKQLSGGDDAPSQ